MSTLSHSLIYLICITGTINGILWHFKPNTKKPDNNTPKDEGFHPSNSCPKSETLTCPQWVMCPTFGERGPCNENEICCSRKQSLTRGCCVKPELPATTITVMPTVTSTEATTEATTSEDVTQPTETTTESVTTEASEATTTTVENTESVTTQATEATASTEETTVQSTEESTISMSTEPVVTTISTEDNTIPVGLTTSKPLPNTQETEPDGIGTTEATIVSVDTSTEASTDTSKAPDAAGEAEFQVTETTTVVDSSSSIILTSTNIPETTTLNSSTEALTTLNPSETPTQISVGTSDPNIGLSTGSQTVVNIDSTTMEPSTELPITVSTEAATAITSEPETTSMQTGTNKPEASSPRIETTTESTFTTTLTPNSRPCTCTCTCQRPSC